MPPPNIPAAWPQHLWDIESEVWVLWFGHAETYMDANLRGGILKFLVWSDEAWQWLPAERFKPEVSILAT